MNGVLLVIFTGHIVFVVAKKILLTVTNVVWTHMVLIFSLIVFFKSGLTHTGLTHPTNYWAGMAFVAREYHTVSVEG